MNKQEFKIYMEKCRVPQSLQPIIEQYQNCFGQNLCEIGLIKTNPPSEFRLTIARNWNGQPYHTTPYYQTPEEQEAIEKYAGTIRSRENRTSIRPHGMESFMHSSKKER